MSRSIGQNEQHLGGPLIGRSMPRLEDPPLLCGEGRFVADINYPHQLHMRVVRSAYAHGAIRSIDTTEAAVQPGVVAIWTAADLDGVPPIGFRDATNPALAPYRQPVLAVGVVRYVGEPVAVVFATDAYLAEDAAELVAVSIDELTPLLAANGPIGAFDAEHGTEPVVLTQSYGDVDSAFATAPTIVEIEATIGRHSAVPLETRGALAVHDRSRDVLELHGAAKVPHRNRDTLAEMLGRPTAGMVLKEGHVGGGFGVRGELYPEDVLVCLGALRLRRPVKWIEDRREHLMATSHSRQQHHHARAAVDERGFVLAIEDRFFLDQGAYARTHGARVVDMTISNFPGPYRFPAYRAAGHFRLTNKTPAATYRAPGYFESSFVRERLLDAIAERLAIDRIAVRRVNLLTPQDMPYPRPLKTHGKPLTLDSGDYPGLLDKALARIGWDALQHDLARRRLAGELVGVGVAVFNEKGGAGPIDGARVEVDVKGNVEVITGGASLGQGFETAMAQICADALGVELGRLRVTHGQTDRIAFGIGAHASRATVMTGNATHAAALAVREKAIELAAELLQTPADALDIVAGTVVVRDRPSGPSISLGEVARHMLPGAKALGRRDPGLAADGWFRTDNVVHPYGVQVVVAVIDRDTGRVRIEKALLIFDVGRAVNPMLVRGQLLGGYVQGLGGTLLEEFLYDEIGQPLCVTLADYMMPTARDVPNVDIVMTEDSPSPFNPLGIKSAGEAGLNGVAAAIASAVDDALSRPGAITRTPITPQSVHALLSAVQA